MNIVDLADKVAANHNLPKAQVKRLFEDAFSAVAEAVASGSEVSIPGFGKFKASERAARQGRNPGTGAIIQIAASRTATFTPAKSLKDQLNTSKR